MNNQPRRLPRISTFHTLSALAAIALASCAQDDACKSDADCNLGELCGAEVCTPDPDYNPGPSETEREQMGEADGLGAGDEPAGVGEAVDAFCGISAYQNGPDFGAVHSNSPFGYEYQCTELAYRFVCQHFDMCDGKAGAYGNANKWFTNYNDPVLKQMSRYVNGGSEPPRPGDILAFNNGTWGHVAIVKSVTDELVHVLEQNVYGGSHYYAINSSGGKYTMAPAVQGWMRAPDGPANCSDDSCGCTGEFDAVMVNGSELFVSGSLQCDAQVEKWSIAVHDTVVFSAYPDALNSVSFSQSIDLSPHGFDMGDAPVGLWALPFGGASGCLLDDGVAALGDDDPDGCEDGASTQCIGDSIYLFDSCGNQGDLVETCSGGEICIQESPTTANCHDKPINCGNGMLDEMEVCDGPLLGDQTCEDFGFEGGEVSCSEACTISTASCCTCISGSCCDGCDLRPSDYVCEADAEAQYACSGAGCGADVTVSYRDRQCSGFSASCEGAFGQWSMPTTIDNCSTDETCSVGDSTCNVDAMCGCSDQYSITQYECQNFSAANGSGSGGGEIFRVCASTDAQTGEMTVEVRKHDGSTFGTRPYQVRVSDVDDDPCGPVTHYFFVSNSNPSGVGSNQLTFEFQSQWLQDQTEKAYCVTASTKAGDPGYDANNEQQQSWWYSDKAVVTRQCI